MLYVACPIWNSKAWPGDFLPAETTAASALAAYAARLNAVEGNTTFYAIPDSEVILRWREQTQEGFRFCLKFPRAITHDRMLVRADRETADWIDRLRLLGDRRGPSFLQLPRDFAPDRFDILAAYLSSLPPDLAHSVEPRNIGWFEKDIEASLNALLTDLGIGRVLFDVRPLRAAEVLDPEARKAKMSKPNVPVRTGRTAGNVHLRYVAHTDLELNERWLAQWAPIAARWIDEGLDVYIAMHTIDESHMPKLCRMFHAMVDAITPLPPLPEPTVDESQMSLF